MDAAPLPRDRDAPNRDAPTLDAPARDVPDRDAASRNAPTSPGTRKPARLIRRAEFLRVAAKGRKVAMPGLVLQALPRSDASPARLGFTVTKKVGNAVIRNRTRRRLKEAARLLLQERGISGVDLVLIGRDRTRARPFVELQQDLRRALDRAGVA